MGHKYHAQPTIVDGIKFASKAEAKRYSELKLLERAKEIGGLCCQPRYTIVVNGKKVCDYIADFSYHDGKKYVVEDVKGVRTPLFVLKKKLFEITHGIEITEISKSRSRKSPDSVRQGGAG